MTLQNNLESKGLIISQHTGEICEWIDLFLSNDGDDTLIIVTPPRYGKTEICKAVREVYESVSYETYFKTSYNPSAKIHIFDDMMKNMIDADHPDKNMNLALKINDTIGKKIIRGSSFIEYGYLKLLTKMPRKPVVLQFPASKYKFEERYDQEWHDNIRSALGVEATLHLMECEI